MAWLILNHAWHWALLPLIATLALILWNGGQVEKFCALAYASQFPLLAGFHLVNGQSADEMSLTRFQPGLFLIDWAQLVLFLLIALRANRLYPLVIAAAQIITVVAHLLRLGVIDMHPRTYAVLIIAPDIVQIAALMAGTAWHAHRLGRIGTYPSWRQA